MVARGDERRRRIADRELAAGGVDHRPTREPTSKLTAAAISLASGKSHIASLNLRPVSLLDVRLQRVRRIHEVLATYQPHHRGEQDEQSLGMHRELVLDPRAVSLGA